jgi:hypothetical protein
VTPEGLWNALDAKLPAESRGLPIIGFNCHSAEATTLWPGFASLSGQPAIVFEERVAVRVMRGGDVAELAGRQNIGDAYRPLRPLVIKPPQ